MFGRPGGDGTSSNQTLPTDQDFLREVEDMAPYKDSDEEAQEKLKPQKKKSKKKKSSTKKPGALFDELEAEMLARETEGDSLFHEMSPVKEPEDSFDPLRSGLEKETDTAEEVSAKEPADSFSLKEEDKEADAEDKDATEKVPPEIELNDQPVDHFAAAEPIAEEEAVEATEKAQAMDLSMEP